MARGKLTSRHLTRGTWDGELLLRLLVVAMSSPASPAVGGRRRCYQSLDQEPQYLVDCPRGYEHCFKKVKGTNMSPFSVSGSTLCTT